MSNKLISDEILTFMHGCPIGSDHAGYDLKSELIAHYQTKDKHAFDDKGTFATESVDYADFAHPIASRVNDSDQAMAVLLCGSGNGIAMTANKYPNVRAALCWNVEIAELARQHNDANILCIPARFVDLDEAISIINTFFSTPFEGGRHKRRIDKIPISE